MTEIVVRVQPDQTGLAKTFDYAVPHEWAERVAPGSMVRIALGPRRVGGWIREVGVDPEPGVEPKPLAKLSGLGPSREVIDLADWARWRWAARTPVPFLRTASPPRMVAALPPPGVRRHPVPSVDDDVVQGAFSGGATVLRLPPAADDIPVVQAATSLGDSLIVCASRNQAERVAGRLRRAGVAVALHPEGWAEAAAGGVTVVGTRAAIWASVPDLSSIVVFDEHDEVHQEERTPTWHVREVAIERARRRRIPCVLASPMPSLEALGTARLAVVDRSVERDGWPKVVVADRRDEDTARNALFSPAFVDVARSGQRVVCILNQKGRAVLLACASCHDLARCDACDAAVQRPGDDDLVCRRCGASRPVVCASCGSTRLKTVRMGVSRVRDDLEALTGERVVAVTADDDERDDGARLFIGTEAALHRIDRADVVAFLDLDQELLAARHRAAEQALALLVRAARLVGSRHGNGLLLLQTRAPDHEVVRAALHGDPTLVSEAERTRRRDFRFPPEVAMAEVSGEAAGAFVDALTATPVSGIDVVGPVNDTWRITAPDHGVLCDALDGVERPSGRLRLAVDPTRS